MKRIFIICFITAILVSTISCGGQANPTTTSPTMYQLTHSAADVEYILNWDSIVSQYPEIGEYYRLEAFVFRGGSKQFSTGETFGLDENSPAAWANTRFVRTEWQGETFRSFGVTIAYFETDAGLDEYIQMIGMTQGTPFQEDGDFVITVLETETPMQSIQLFLFGKRFAIMLMEYATPDKSLFLSKDALTGLFSTAVGNINSVEITPLPSAMPGGSSQ